MKTEEINQSIESMNLYLTKDEKIEHWLNFIILLMPIILIGYVPIETAIQNKEFSFFALILTGLILLLLRHKLISPKLYVYKTNLTKEQFKQANQAAAKLNDWIILADRKDYFSAIKKVSWQWDGIKITAILKGGKLYLNSMVNPSNRSNPFTFGLNKKNKMELIHQYQSILKGNNVSETANSQIKKREEKFWNESEWTFVNIVKRIVGYGLSILFIVFAYWMMSEGEVQGLIYGMVLLGFCGSYIFYDIKVILKKNKKKKTKPRPNS